MVSVYGQLDGSCGWENQTIAQSQVCGHRLKQDILRFRVEYRTSGCQGIGRTAGGGGQNHSVHAVTGEVYPIYVDINVYSPCHSAASHYNIVKCMKGVAGTD